MALPFYYNPATNELELTADPSPLRESLGTRFGLNEISTRAKTLSPTKSHTAESVMPSQFDEISLEEMEDIKKQAGVGEQVKKDPYPWEKPQPPWWEDVHEPAPWDAKDGGRIDMKPGGIVEPGVTHYGDKKYRHGTLEKPHLVTRGPNAGKLKVATSEGTKWFKDETEFKDWKKTTTSSELDIKLNKFSELITKSNNQLKMVYFEELAQQAGFKKRPNFVQYLQPFKDNLPKLDDPIDKVNKALKHVLADTDRPAIEFANIYKQISKLTGLPGESNMGRYLNQSPLYLKYRNAFNYINVPLSKLKVLQKGKSLTFTDVIKMYERVPEGSKYKFRGYGSAAEKIMQIAKRHVDQGGNKIKFTKPFTKANDIFTAEFKYKGGTYTMDSLAEKGRFEKNFETFYNLFDERQKRLNKNVPHPVTGKEVPYGELMSEAYTKATGKQYTKFDVEVIDHKKGVRVEPYEDIRFLDQRTNQAAGNIMKQAEMAKWNLNPNEAHFYTPKNTKILLDKTGYLHDKSPDKLMADGLKLAKDILVPSDRYPEGRKLRTPITIGKEYLKLLSYEEKVKVAKANNCPLPIKGKAEGGRIGFGAGSGSMLACIDAKFEKDPKGFFRATTGIVSKGLDKLWKYTSPFFLPAVQIGTGRLEAFKDPTEPQMWWDIMLASDAVKRWGLDKVQLSQLKNASWLKKADIIGKLLLKFPGDKILTQAAKVARPLIVATEAISAAKGK
jgi:hypothetical protein